MKIFKIIILSVLLLSLKEGPNNTHHFDYSMYTKGLGEPIEEIFYLSTNNNFMDEPFSGCKYRIIVDFDTFAAKYSAK